MKALTLIDITETKLTKNRSDDKVACSQQANWMTFVQTMMLRTNIMCDSPRAVKYSATEFKKLGFGDQYKGSHTVWEVDCSTDEYQYFPPSDVLDSDFDMVPVVKNLKENCIMEDALFCTSDAKKCNILFKILAEDDKYSI